MSSTKIRVDQSVNALDGWIGYVQACNAQPYSPLLVWHPQRTISLLIPAAFVDRICNDHIFLNTNKCSVLLHNGIDTIHH